MARRERAASGRRAFRKPVVLTDTDTGTGMATSLGMVTVTATTLDMAPALQLVQPGSDVGPAPAAGSAPMPASAPAECWIALHLPALLIEALNFTATPVRRSQAGARSPHAPPLVVFEAQGGMPRVVAADAAARKRGVVPGLTLAAALAMSSELDARPRQPRRERALLAHLAGSAFAFTPRISLDPPDSVLLEVRGSLGLFGGAQSLCDAVQACCAGLGLSVQLALAPTPLAALMLARAGRALLLSGSERLVGALGPLPLRFLRWAPPALARLESMGVRTCGEALRLPRAGFARRFGRAALEDLDRLVGRRPDPRRPFIARERFRGRCEPSFELEHHAAILRHLEPLLADLERFLRSRQAAVLLLRLRLHHRADPCDGSPRRTPLELRLAAPEFAAARFAALLTEHLARLALPAPVRVLELRSGELQPLAAQSESLWRPGEHGGGATREASALIERLRARLGQGAVHGLCLVPDHRPERCSQVAEPCLPAPAAASARPVRDVPAKGLPVLNAALSAPGGPICRRPLWLLQAPQLLAQGSGGLQLLEGPERIEAGWWDGADVTRDYYVARDAAGVLLWVFRERLPPHAWCLHGVFG